MKKKAVKKAKKGIALKEKNIRIPNGTASFDEVMSKLFTVKPPAK